MTFYHFIKDCTITLSLYLESFLVSLRSRQYLTDKDSNSILNTTNKLEAKPFRTRITHKSDDVRPFTVQTHREIANYGDLWIEKFVNIPHT